ncbi:hypothetical protein [Mucilaginibacter sp. KACC 22063]|uniref:hypothetical protein n=1 Tax=Mucilaginibacter sp. KACC 22063 TaxID=3025666 RepID=UPI002366591D|nr:hypothetical protein [Mucilaginibacter sp. KACC 22063]WDF57266.1 hypothetical protein PQ461_09395 [Mucilaginibacter sp. KACC 22063]
MKSIFKIIVAAIAVFSSCKPAPNADELINQKASLPDHFKLSELHQKVITSFINNRNHTTSILYGNEKALSSASSDKLNELPGESFTLVTWKQQDDAHWFGARIPGDLISAERLDLTDSNSRISYNYQRFSGKDLVKLADTTENSERIKFILNQKASIIP